MQTFTKLRAEVNLLKRNNLRLKADKAADLQKMEELAAAGRALRQQLADSKVTADKLRAEVGVAEMGGGGSRGHELRALSRPYSSPIRLSLLVS